MALPVLEHVGGGCGSIPSDVRLCRGLKTDRIDGGVQMGRRKMFFAVKRVRVHLIAVVCAFVGILSFGLPVGAQTSYQKPPKEILDVMNAPVVPTGTVNPTGDYMIISRQVGYPTIADLAQPMLRLA